MLLALRISNLAVIEEVEVEFGPGLTVLTGETGAGKSILVDALGLLLGGRGDPQIVRAGCEEATVEGVFAPGGLLGPRLGELGLPAGDEEVSVRRVVGRSGRGKAYVNGALVTVGVLSRLMRGVVDISGQHEHVSLFDPAVHRSALDAHGALGPLLQAYRTDFGAWRDLVARMAALGGDEAQVRERLELLRFQRDEISKLAPERGEDERLDAERRRLAGAQKLRRQASEAELLLRGDEGSAVGPLGKALALVIDAARVDASLYATAQSLSSSMAELDGAARALGRYAEALESDPQRLAEVEERLDAIKRLCRKHGCDLDGLVARQQLLETELVALEEREGVLEVLGRDEGGARSTALASAAALSDARRAAALALAEEVSQELGRLALKGAVLEVRVRREEALGPDGADAVELFFSANPGEPPQPLTKVASGGEASRLLLALKRVLSRTGGGGCYVLDEADAGVSGAVADVVGRMIKDVSRRHQVLCITHLPQVAAHADSHVVIRKQLRGERTVSELARLASAAARTEELARMLSGVEVTREALGAAEALVRSAQGAVSAARRPKKAPPPPRGSQRLRRSA